MTGRIEPAQDECSMDSMLDVLSSSYRRRLLVALLEQTPQDAGDAQLPTDVVHGTEELQQYRIKMYHQHLPKLENAGFIEWNRSESFVRVGPRFDEIRPLLELLHDHADELPGVWV